MVEMTSCAELDRCTNWDSVCCMEVGVLVIAPEDKKYRDLKYDEVG